MPENLDEKYRAFEKRVVSDEESAVPDEAAPKRGQVDDEADREEEGYENETAARGIAVGVKGEAATRHWKAGILPAGNPKGKINRQAAGREDRLPAEKPEA
jgi:hypothetical protein